MISPTEAARLCGLSYAGYRACVAKGIYPGCAPGTRKVSVRALERAIDKLYSLDIDSSKKLISRPEFDFEAELGKINQNANSPVGRKLRH